MPWRKDGVKDQQMWFVVEASQTGANIAQVCRKFGISRTCGHKWLQRYEEVGALPDLAEKSRRPHSSPHKTASEYEEAAIKLRKEYGWGAKKLRILLEHQGIDLPTVTINRIIRRNGLLKSGGSGMKGGDRFEKSRPNEMFQMDFKGHYYLANGRCYPLVIVDDYSRLL